jgi:hypothetical protein
MGNIFPHKSIESVGRALGLLMNSIYSHKVLLQLTVDDFKSAVLKVQAQEPDVTHWTFGECVARSVLFPDFGS